MSTFLCVGVSAGSVTKSSVNSCNPMDSSPRGSMRFPRRGYWSRLPFSSPGDLPDPRIKPGSPAGSLLRCRQILYQLTFPFSSISTMEVVAFITKKLESWRQGLHPGETDTAGLGRKGDLEGHGVGQRGGGTPGP